MAPAIAVLIVLLLLLALLFYTPFGDMLLSGLFSDTYPAYSDFTVTRTIQITVTGGMINYELDLPKSEDFPSSGSVQDVHSIVTSPMANEINKYGSEWLTWSGSTATTVSFSITYAMTVHTMLWEIESGESAYVNDIPATLVQQQTGDEWEYAPGQYKIWPSNNEIRTLAQSLTSTDARVLEKVESIYNYVDRHVSYTTISGSEPKSCIRTLSDGTGDCDDQSILLISLCRAIGIPSWLAFGGLYDSVSGDWGSHAWAEVYIPLASGEGGSVTIDAANHELLVRNCNRFEEWKSDGNGEHLEDYYHLLSYDYLSGDTPSVDIIESYSGVYQASGETVSRPLLKTGQLQFSGLIQLAADE